MAAIPRPLHGEIIFVAEPAPSVVDEKERGLDLRRILLVGLRTLLIALAVRTLIGEASLVPTPSMENTVMVGDHLFWTKALYGPEIPFTHWRLPRLRHVQRGEIVAFRSPLDASDVFLKRVIATSGDSVEMRDGVLYLNGVAQQERYALYMSRGEPASVARPGDFARVIVPRGKIFVMGDNRDNSADSREFGFVPETNVLGEPVMVLWSYDAPSSSWLDERPRRELAFYGSIATHLFSRTRWSRIGILF
jgi:signal peptidase I